jgi:hypothetical protein
LAHARFHAAWVDLSRSLAGGTVPTYDLAQVPPADLDIPSLAQLAPSQLPLGDAREPRALKIVRLDAALRGGRSGNSR